MRENDKQQFYFSHMTKRLRKRIKGEDNPERLNQIHDIVGEGLEQFSEKLRNREIKIDLNDFEKLVKLELLLQDKPTEVVENRTDIEEITITDEFQQLKEMPEFEALKNQWAENLNKRNEQD